MDQEEVGPRIVQRSSRLVALASSRSINAGTSSFLPPPSAPAGAKRAETNATYGDLVSKLVSSSPGPATVWLYALMYIELLLCLKHQAAHEYLLGIFGVAVRLSPRVYVCVCAVERVCGWNARIVQLKVTEY